MAAINTPIVNKMPWIELIDAFIKSLPERMRRKDVMNSKNPLIEFNEFRLLTIGGPRQTGKTHAGRQTVVANKKVRLIYANHQAPVEGIQKIKQRTIKNIDQETIKDVEILVIDQDGYPLDRNDPLREVKYMFDHNPELFHPNFSVIHIL